jgi:tetratricopeptide (TPR) repeat protein
MKINKYKYLLNEYSKIVGIYTDLDSLCASIREEIDLVDKQLETFSFFNEHQKSTKDLSRESAEFLWFQLFTHVILRLPRNKQAKKQMLDVCRHYYRGNPKEQKLIDEFEHNYRPDEAIQWYSKQSFVYKLVNKALRSEDIDQLHTFRFFIGDLSESLAREHQKLVQTGEQILTVYRGAKLSNEEFDKLKENQGNLISTNGYLSTSRLRQQALTFAKKRTKRTDAVPVLFQIECAVQQLGDSLIFADIAKFSNYENEEEVLFDLSAAFRLTSIQQDGPVWIVNMSASGDGKALARDYIEIMRRETEEKSVAIMFGRLMCQMGEYQKSKKYFEQLLNDPNGEDLAWIEFNIGRALHYKGEWKVAQKYYTRAYDRMMNVDPPRIKDSAYILNSLGTIHQSQEEYQEALHFYQRALKIYEKYYPDDHPDTAYSLHSIGCILHIQGQDEEALKKHRQALEIRKKHYPAGHPDIARSLNNIRNVLDTQGKHSEALFCYQEALAIRQKHYPAGHPDIAYSLNNIGRVLHNQTKLDEALHHHQQALTIREKLYSGGHPELATSLHNIGNVLHAQEKYEEALHFHHRALTIREEYYSGNHSEIAHSLSDIGATYENLNQLKNAVDFYQRAMKIYKTTLSIDHPKRKKTERNIRRLSLQE